MENTLKLPALALLTLALTACDSGSNLSPEVASPQPAPPAPAPVIETNPADAFMQNVAGLCGNAYAGRVVEDTPAPTGDDPFGDKPLVMHVRECNEDAIRIPFHVGDDHSRTWVLTRTATGLRLKHDHRHEDGSDDEVTMYGGETSSTGSATRQEFPVDAESRAMFSRNDMEVSNANTWAMEIEPGDMFAYELSRPERMFRVEFDLTETVPSPPAPWGAEDAADMQPAAPEQEEPAAAN